jgi:hypothetical protein
MEMKITIPITFEKICDKHGGQLHVYIADCFGDVVDENKNVIGRIGASVGGHIDIMQTQNNDLTLWTADPISVWNAFQTALNSINKQMS